MADLTCLGVIPARGGSKGIPRKNLALLAGRPLLAYTCDAARACRRLARVIVSTDDAEIAAGARAGGVDVPFVRPAELSADDTPMLAVARHALDACELEAGAMYDAVVILQPTSPLRPASAIDAAIERMKETGADTVVTVVRVPHAFEPGSLMRLDERGRLVPGSDAPLVLRRQDKPVLFARNGPAVLVIRRATLVGGSLYGPHVEPLEMAARESVDVDGPEDLALAEALIGRRDAGH
jgi:CMP-N-acetylneuraminic acid synthetase